MIEVFETRDEIDNDIVPRKLVSPLSSICLTPSEYHGLISAVILLMILLLSITLAAGLAYRFVDALFPRSQSFLIFHQPLPQTLLGRDDKEPFVGPQFTGKFIHSVGTSSKHERVESSIQCVHLRFIQPEYETEPQLVQRKSTENVRNWVCVAGPIDSIG